MGIETAIALAGLAVAAGGTGYAANRSHEAENTADRQRRTQERAVAQQVATRDANLGQVRAQYGIGSSADAQTNGRTLADSINQYYQEQLGANLKSADDQFATTSRTSRQNLARVGQLGSGLDAASQSGTLADFLKARQQAVSQAGSARDSLSNSLTNQRLGYESQINGGTLANPDFSAIGAQRDAALASAQSNVAPSAIGNLFSTAGSTYFNGQQQGAYGNQGLQAFGFSSGGKNRGSIT